MSVCLFVCLSVRSETMCPNFTIFISTCYRSRSLRATCPVAGFSSDNSAVRYLRPVLWMTSCFYIMGPMGQSQGWRYVLSGTPGCGIGGRSLTSMTACYCNLCYLELVIYLLYDLLCLKIFYIIKIKLLLFFFRFFYLYTLLCLYFVIFCAVFRQ